MKFFYYFLGVISMTTLVFAQQIDLITNVDSRTQQTLNGQWQIIIDPYENGFYNYRYQEKETDGYFENKHMNDKTKLIEYNFDRSQTLQVPGDWNSQLTELLYYEGTIWYKKDFNYNKKENTRIFIYFGAVNYEAHVWVNGKKVGTHEGGFTAFNFEISSAVVNGSNFIVVKVDNKRRREAVPTLNTDWWNYGGITRDVSILELPEKYIENYFIQVKKGSTNEITGWVKMKGISFKEKVKIKIEEAGILKRVTTDTEGVAVFTIKADLQRWSPEDPKLYNVEISSNYETLTDKIGFRTLETRGIEILLNGKPVFLKGICMHEEAPMRSSRAHSKEDALIALNWVKELNGNFIRLAHYPHNEKMIRQADEMGIMIWSEIPVYWTILWENGETFANARHQLEEMISRDYNRASVIIWSVGNETPLGQARLKFMSGLVERARELDSSRFISAALERHYINTHTLMIDDPLGAYLDVFGCNEYIGWYDGLPQKADSLVWKSKYNKPHIISEFGGGALQGYYGDKLTRWTEEYQASVYKHQLKMLDKIQFVSGLTPWILIDFRSPRRPLPTIQDGWNRKGVISERGIKKQAFYILQKYYKDK